MSDKKIIVFGVDGLIPEFVYKFSSEGYLPNIKKMMEDGAVTELLPFISTWGDVNWVSFLTGQSPGTSWRGQGTPSDNRENLLGIMQRENKKAALVHFPGTVSVNETDHFLFAPFHGGTGKNKFELCVPAVHSTDLTQWNTEEQHEFLGWPSKGTLAHHLKRNIHEITRENQGLYHLHLKTVDSVTHTIIVKVLNDSQLLLDLDGDSSITLHSNEWSSWSTFRLNEKLAYVRFKLVDWNPENGSLTILQSQINSTDNFSNNRMLESQLISNNGPFISKWTVTASLDEPYYETSFEEGAYQGQWLANAALNLVEDEGYDLFATVFRLNDETHHTSLGQLDSTSPFYDKENSEQYEEIIRNSYEILDEAIGILLNGKSEDTIVILASDHGDVPNFYFCDIYKRLEECGLAVLDDKGEPVLSESLAYLKDDRGGLEVYVNLKEKEPFGIVDRIDYFSVQTKIFHALSTWYYETEKGLENVVALTLKKQDASMIGYWGEEMGDVIFTYNQGFVWGSNNKDQIGPVSSPGANHGPQAPTARTSDSSNFGILLVFGNMIQEGYKRNNALQGYYRMNDVGTTIAQLLGTTCRTLDGRVMTDLLK